MENNGSIKVETQSGYVVAGVYEDRAEYINQEHYFRIRLDRLIQPEEKLVVEEFFGTLEQIDDLLSEIDKDEWWREYYASTLYAWDKYRAGDHGAVHFVGNNIERMLTPVSEICWSACLIDDVKWCYQDKFGCAMLAGANMVDASQVLLQDGDRYIRAAKYWFEGLSRVHSDKGWISYDGVSRGIPCMIESFAEGAVKNRIMVVEDVYDDINAAMSDMQTEGKYNYQQISRELFSGC